MPDWARAVFIYTLIFLVVICVGMVGFSLSRDLTSRPSVTYVCTQEQPGQYQCHAP